jgi:isoquinoline 1-oxidoreductase beta subunit
MNHIVKITRRDFLRAVGIGTGAVVFGYYAFPPAAASELTDKLSNGFPVEGVPFVAIKVNGDMVIITHRSEMGQGIRSSLAAVLVDELEADWNRVTLRQADADGRKYAIEFPFDVSSSVTLPFPYEQVTIASRPQYLIPPEGSQFTEGSRSMAAYFQSMRLFGTGIRLLMIRAAAEKFGVDPRECVAQKHRVMHPPSGRSIDYRWLLLRAQKEKPPTGDEIEAGLKKPQEWRYIGTDRMPFFDASEMVRGKTIYCGDINLPGMLTASIEHCPVANGALVSFDDAPALAVPGVRRVMPILPLGMPGGGVGTAVMPHAGVAVLANNTWAAIRGRQALKPTIRWDLGPNAAYDSEQYRKQLESSTSNPGMNVRSKGNVDTVLAQAVRTVEARYYIPHLAQAPMEPPVAVAHFQKGRMEVWAPTQCPDLTQLSVGQIALELTDVQMRDESFQDKARAAVTLHVTMVGGGFGRKAYPDFVVEAAILAKQNPGVPIRVQWTREDDIQFSYYNAVSSQYLKAGLDGEGHAMALLQRSAFPSFFATFFPPPTMRGLTAERSAAHAMERYAYPGGGIYPYASAIERAQGLEDMPFDVPNLRIENCRAQSYIRVGCMRSAANIYHAFGICSFADELAAAAGHDSKDYLLDLIGKGRILPLAAEGVENYDNNAFPMEQVVVPIGGQMVPILPGYPPDTRRLRAVVERVAKDADWDAKVRKYKGLKGRGLGIAAHRSRLSYVAIVIDVSLDENNKLMINEIYGTIDCGLAVNRDRIVAQMQGGIIYGLSLALFGEITVKDGGVVQNNFDDYPVLRINQTPRKISVHIMASAEPPTGAGEPPTPAVAPALCNAIVAAGGPRIRELPIRNNKTLVIA